MSDKVAFRNAIKHQLSEMKKCTKCSKTHSGSSSKCPPCYAAWAREWRTKNPAINTAICKAYRERHPERWKAYNRNYSLRKAYGITSDDYDSLLLSQGGKCAICRTDKPGGPGRMMVDHHHKSGAVRGLLCCNCNFVIGHSLEQPAILKSAIAYLERGK